MSVNTITLNDILPNTVPSGGWYVDYRIKGSSAAFVQPMGSPFSTVPITFNTTDPVGTLYEGHIWAECEYSDSTKYYWSTPCNCTTSGYTPVPADNECTITNNTSPTIVQSCICYAASRNTAYTNYGSRIYMPSLTETALNNAIFLPWNTVNPTVIYGQMGYSPQWSNPSMTSSTIGPMNKRSIWVDSACSGTPNTTIGGTFTIGFTFNNTGAARQVYVGIAGDNQFILNVNGTEIANTNPNNPYSLNGITFKIWHIIPIQIIQGVNYFNVTVTGVEGSVNAVGFAIYDNTAAQLMAAVSDSSLTILFDSNSLNYQTNGNIKFTLASCPTGYSLDTSGGCSDYTCSEVLYKPCNTIS